MEQRLRGSQGGVLQRVGGGCTSAGGHERQWLCASHGHLCYRRGYHHEALRVARWSLCDGVEETELDVTHGDAGEEDEEEESSNDLKCREMGSVGSGMRQGKEG